MVVPVFPKVLGGEDDDGFGEVRVSWLIFESFFVGLNL
jgi:hypothetical protein